MISISIDGSEPSIVEDDDCIVDVQTGGQGYCAECSEFIDFDDARHGHDDDCQSYDPDARASDRPIGDLINGASVRVTHDQIQVSISVEDPRGAFVMSLERDSAGRLRLSVPGPTDSCPHVGLQVITDGLYGLRPYGEWYERQREKITSGCYSSAPLLRVDS